MSAGVDEERKQLPTTSTRDTLPGREAGAVISPTLEFKTHGVDFKPWVRGFVAQLRRNLTRPSSSMKEKAQVVIVFDVDRQGGLSQIQIVEKSSDVALDEAAMHALRASNPTMPLPAGYPKDVVRITASVSYSPVQQPSR
jgi:TonB family protein